jgi:hypothetical protein
MTTRFLELKRQYDFSSAVAAVKSPLAPADTIKVPLPVSLEYLQTACSEIASTYGLRGFVSCDGVDANPDYASISLTHNPACGEPENYSTLGCSKLSKEEHYYATPETLAKVGGARDSYYDTYGFRFPTSPAKNELGKLIGSLKRNLIRSRISVIRAGAPGPSGFFWGWHKDEPVFENLRINIHVTDSNSHKIQVMREDRMPAHPQDPAIRDHQFEAGFGYSWDTNLPHRACAVGNPNHDRVAIILGVSPWFDLNAATGEWEPNEFFGVKHPHQMLLDGDIL